MALIQDDPGKLVWTRMVKNYTSQLSLILSHLYQHVVVSEANDRCLINYLHK